MTLVDFDRREGRCSVRARGHATGSVEVCAAVSMLLQALAEYAAQQGALESARLESGYGEVVLRDTPHTAPAWALCVCGLELLAAEYGEYVGVAEGCTESL